MDTRLVESPLADVAEVEQQALLATPIEALTWAWDLFGDRCCVLSSMKDATMIELALRVDRRFPVVFLDTGYHFEQTWQTLRSVERHYGIEVEVVGPLTEPKHDVAPGECCDEKPALLEAALAGRNAWVSGLRRHQTANRKAASIVGVDGAGRTKLNPIVQWSDEDHARFVDAADIIQNPLLGQGYTSIGCRTCTVLPTDATDPRSGRWADSERTECGLHL